MVFICFFEAGAQANQALQLAALQQAMARNMHPGMMTAQPTPRPVFNSLGAHGFGGK